MRRVLLLALSCASVAVLASDAADVLVTRGGVSVTLQDVDTFVARVPKEQRKMFIDSPSRIRDLLNNMLVTKQLAEQARAAHLDRQPDIASQLRAAEDDVLAKARLADFMNNIEVPDLKPLVAEQYAAHKELYRLPRTVDVQQILIGTDHRSDDDARVLADQVRNEAASHPKNFDALVGKYSDDGSTADKGLFKDATSEKYVKEFREAAAALDKVGDVSPVVHSSYGYHILKLVAVHPGRQRSLDEVKDQLAQSMREQYIGNQRRDFINGLNNQPVDINSATLDTLRDRYDENGEVRVVNSPAPKSGGSQPAPSAH